MQFRWEIFVFFVSFVVNVFLCELYPLDHVRFAHSFDRTAGLCQATPMFRATGKFIAVILALWLPLFSGNALAMSVAMQAMRGDCHSTVAQQDEHHCAATSQQHAHHDQLAAEQDQSSSHQGNAGDDCGTCHLACCGYLAAATLKVRGEQPSSPLFRPVSARFHSFTPAPLDPPPLARA